LARSEGFAPSGGGGDLESLFLPYLAYRLNGRPADGRALTAFRQNLRALRQVLHWATGAPRSGAVDSLYDIVDQFFPRDQEVRRLLEGEVVRPLTAFYRGVSAYLLGFYAESIRLLDGLRRASGASLPLADYYVGLAYLRSGDEPAAIDALSRFLATVPPDRRRGPTVADAQRRLHEVLRASRAHPSAFRSGRLLPGYAETPGGNVAVTPTNTDTALLQRWRRTAAGKPQAPKPAAKRLSLV
jgi:tetratricopeptide (TPR) repeat protein